MGEPFAPIALAACKSEERSFLLERFPRGRVPRRCGRTAKTSFKIASVWFQTGPGIASNERDKVLERFYRSDRTRAVEGHGLGLSMAVTIVELHGFGLRIRDNAPGSIFEITARPDAAQQDRPKART